MGWISEDLGDYLSSGCLFLKVSKFCGDKTLVSKAWNYTQALETSGIGLGAPSTVSLRLKDFSMEVPFAK